MDKEHLLMIDLRNCQKNNKIQPQRSKRETKSSLLTIT